MTDINNYTQKSRNDTTRKTMINTEEIVNFNRKSVADINNTLKSRNETFNPKFALNRNNSTTIIAVLTNSETDINNTQKSRNDTFRKSMIITKGIDNLNRKSVTYINNTQKSINNKKKLIGKISRNPA